MKEPEDQLSKEYRERQKERLDRFKLYCSEVGQLIIEEKAKIDKQIQDLEASVKDSANALGINHLAPIIEQLKEKLNKGISESDDEIKKNYIKSEKEKLIKETLADLEKSADALKFGTSKKRFDGLKESEKDILRYLFYSEVNDEKQKQHYGEFLMLYKDEELDFAFNELFEKGLLDMTKAYSVSTDIKNARFAEKERLETERLKKEKQKNDEKISLLEKLGFDDEEVDAWANQVSKDDLEDVLKELNLIYCNKTIAEKILVENPGLLVDRAKYIEQAKKLISMISRVKGLPDDMSYEKNPKQFSTLEDLIRIERKFVDYMNQINTGTETQNTELHKGLEDIGYSPDITIAVIEGFKKFIGNNYFPVGNLRKNVRGKLRDGRQIRGFDRCIKNLIRDGVVLGHDKTGTGQVNLVSLNPKITEIENSILRNYVAGHLGYDRDSS